MKYRYSIVIGLLLFAICGILSLPLFAVVRPVDRYDFSTVDNKIDAWIDSGYYNGASLIVVKNNKVIYQRYFGSYKPNTVAYIASAGKWLAAATIAAVVDEGKLSWNDPVRKWLPQFTDSKGDATLRQLLSHTSGYPDYQPKGEHPDDYQTLSESVQHIINLRPDAAPGAEFRYGGLSMQVAGRMAELATGKSWERIFREKIAGPLHMDSTHFTPVSAVGGQNPMIGGGARATLQDYANFLEMVSNNGEFHGKQILSAKAIMEMEADQVKNAELIPPTADYVKKARGKKHHSIYGLGEWREELDNNGNATLISSPSWAGAYPWIDKTNHVYGFLLARVNEDVAHKHNFSSFYGSTVLPVMIRTILNKK